MLSSNQEIGARILSMRKFQKLTREKLAEKSEISIQFLADIESGKKGMTVATLQKICNALNVSADSIVFGRADKSTSNINSMLETLPQEKIAAIEQILQQLIKII